MKSARAYDVSGFGVGCGVPRVKIIGKTEEKSPFTLIDREGRHQDYLYLVQVTSRKCHGFRTGEVYKCAGANLWDRIGYCSGPKLSYQGKQWKELVK